MKRLLCLFTAIIIIMSLAACSTNDAESGSDGQEISKTEISRQDEQSSEDESSFAEVSEPVSEEASEPVSEEISEPSKSGDDEPPTEYRLIEAHNAHQMAEKLKELALSIEDPATVMSIEERELYEPLNSILAEGYIINPVFDGVQVESDPESPYGSLEIIFHKSHKVSLLYYFRNSDDVWANVQITYPNEEISSMIRKHGIDGYRMYYAGSEKAVDKLSADEIAKTGFRSVSLSEINCGGEKFEAIKYVNKSTASENRVIFMYEGKIVVITYVYRSKGGKSGENIDDILDTIKLEKLYFDESSEDVSRDEPQPSIDPEDFPYRVVSAHSAAELVAKLKDISDKINGNKASDFNMKDIDYLEPIDDILSLGYIFNPSVDGIYAENDSEEPHGKIEMVFRADHTVTAIYYCRNDDDIWASIQIVYPNADIIRLTGEYGAEGLGMYNAKSNKRITEMTEQQQTNAGFRNATIENITLEGQIYDSMKYARSSGGTTTTIVYEGIPVVISYKYNSEELKATHNADEILDTIKLEKLYFPAE